MVAAMALWICAEYSQISGKGNLSVKIVKLLKRNKNKHKKIDIT